MMHSDKNSDVMLLVGRVFIAIVFIVFGFGKLTGFAGAVGFVGTVFPFPELFTVLAIIFELGGGLMLLLGFKTRIAALMLIVFTVIAMFAYHFDFANQAQSLQFMKDLAIVGGLLYVKVFGAGRYSLDASMGKKDTMMKDSMSMGA